MDQQHSTNKVLTQTLNQAIQFETIKMQQKMDDIDSILTQKR